MGADSTETDIRQGERERWSMRSTTHYERNLTIIHLIQKFTNNSKYEKFTNNSPNFKE